MRLFSFIKIFIFQRIEDIFVWMIPVYMTLYVIKEQKTMLYPKYLCFWAILAIILGIERITFYLFHYITFYRTMRSLFVIWLQLNDCNNSIKIFETLKPFIAKNHKKIIQKALNSVTEKLDKHGDKIKEKALHQFWQIVNQNYELIKGPLFSVLNTISNKAVDSISTNASMSESKDDHVIDKKEKDETVRIKEQMMTCEPDRVEPPEMPQAPRPKARAFFSDNIIAESLALPYVIDSISDYVGEGSYPNNRTAFPKAAAGTFDGIAVDENTRVIMWEQPDFQGRVLLDVTGPTIINNIKHKNGYSPYIAKDFSDPELQRNYPPNVRVYSEEDMNPWTNGSVKIVAL